MKIHAIVTLASLIGLFLLNVYKVEANGSMSITSTTVGQTVSILSELDASDCKTALTAITVGHLFFHVEPIRQNRTIIDFSQARVELIVDGTRIPGYISDYTSSGITWYPYISFQGSEAKIVSVVINNAKIVNSGNAGFVVTLVQEDGNACVGLHTKQGASDMTVYQQTITFGPAQGKSYPLLKPQPLYEHMFRQLNTISF